LSADISLPDDNNSNVILEEADVKDGSQNLSTPMGENVADFGISRASRHDEVRNAG